MKKVLLFSLFGLLALGAFAQKKFEKGYYIDNDGTRKEGLISLKNRSEVQQFYFKSTADADAQLIELSQSKAFGVGTQIRYERFKLLADVDLNNQGNLDNKKAISPKEQILFLKVIVNGEASLFSYEKNKAKYFFYRKAEETPQQLVYKRYQLKVGEVKTNNQYQQQLWNTLSCTAWTPEEVNQLKYKRSSLLKLFTAYNQKCGSKDFVSYKNKTRKALKLSIKPRWNTGLMTLERPWRGQVLIEEIPQTASPFAQFGLELEYILAFNKERWSIFMEPNYVAYAGALDGVPVFASGEPFNLSRQGRYLSEYRAVELPIGFRYHLPVARKFNIFASAAYAFELPLAQIVSTERRIGVTFNELELNSEHITYLGAGINYNHQYSIEFRYGLKRELVNRQGTWKTYFESFSIMLGYNFLPRK